VFLININERMKTVFEDGLLSFKLSIHTHGDEKVKNKG
jgi:hypothetical protein